MTTQGREAARPWQDSDFAASWTASDGLADMLEFPRHIAAALVGLDREPRLVVDIASGPGAFLATFLDEYPNARGIWHDASDAMLAEAKQRLSRFGDRIEYSTGDMTDLSTAGIPNDVDVITTSRAAHHLDRDALHAFYREAAEHLAPGGWLTNLDHVGPEERWNQRLRAVRPRFTKGGGEGPKHHHNYPLTSIEDHVSAYNGAGITDVDIAWRAFYTCLFIGRKDG
ncbi:MAG: class I SAM-dependent methyltransferase [Trebonia sp.]